MKIPPSAVKELLRFGVGDVAVAASRTEPVNRELLDYLPRFSEAVLHINESQDLETVLQRTLDTARSLADARYGVMVILDGAGQVETLLTSGLSPDEFKDLLDTPGSEVVFEYLGSLTKPLRVEDLAGHIRSQLLPDFLPPVPARSFMATPIRHWYDILGYVYLAQSEPDRRFTAENEVMLESFAAQSALAMTNAKDSQFQREARLHQDELMDRSPAGIWVFDAKTLELTGINREARRIGGYQYDRGMTLDEVRGSRGLRYLDGRDVPTEERPVNRVIRDGERIHAEELVLVRPDGLAFPGLFSAVPLYAPDGNMSQVVLTVVDLRPREDRERLRAEFLGMISHELRGPLTSIKGSASIMLNSPAPLDPAETRQLIRIIDQQADRMRDLINNLLDLTRIEAGHLSINREPADAAEIIGQARSAFLTHGRSGPVAVDCPPGLPRVWADRQRVEQVLDNLLSNAARFSPEGSVINIAAARSDPHYLEISVTDHGRGIPPEDLDSIFAKFSRGRHPEEAGHGLGLAICKGIVEAHGGRIWVESGQPGQGARFTFTLPVDETADAAAQSATPLANSERTPVLVIDDDPQILRYLTHTLTGAGYDPISTDDPRQVGRLLTTKRPQLILLDLMLSESDAFELLERTPALLEKPVIFLSGNSEERNIVRALEMGACDYIIKPFSPAELVARVATALRKRPASGGGPPQSYVSGDLAVNFAEHTVTVSGDLVQLTPTEYALLRELALNAGRVLTHSQLLERVWAPEYAGNGARLLRAFVASLRKKLGDDAKAPSYILTEPRVGYRMRPPDARA